MATIKCMLHEAGQISKERPAIIGEDIQISYGELDLMVSVTASRLRDIGVGPGQRIALFMESGWKQIVLIFGLMRVGAVVCPLSTRLPIAAVRQQLRMIQCTCLIARVSPESASELSGVTCIAPDDLVSVTVSGGQSDDQYDIAVDQPATIIFTSGSAGLPKAALLSYGNLYYSAYGSNMNVRLRREDAWLLSLPLYHVGGLGILFRCVESGAAIVIMKQGEAVRDALARVTCTHLSLVPTQLHYLLQADLPESATAKLKAILIGGSAVSENLLARARERKWPLFPSYGLTEMTALVTTVKPISPPHKRTTSGMPLRYRQVRITDDGAILVKGQTLFLGYIEGDRIVRDTDAHGWFATGDLGEVDAEGYLTVTGRKDNQFISGGENIQPEEIERALCALPNVQEALVVPQPDDVYGQRPIAYIRTVEPPDEQALRDALEKILPRFKIPIAFHPWSLLDDNGMKPKRR